MRPFSYARVEDVDAALKKGDLKFQLDGYKLKGSWVLVRTRGPRDPSGRSWLLIKHHDEWSGEVDITDAVVDLAGNRGVITIGGTLPLRLQPFGLGPKETARLHRV